eukprot:IDg7591t1
MYLASSGAGTEKQSKSSGEASGSSCGVTSDVYYIIESSFEDEPEKILDKRQRKRHCYGSKQDQSRLQLSLDGRARHVVLEPFNHSLNNAVARSMSHARIRLLMVCTRPPR